MKWLGRSLRKAPLWIPWDHKILIFMAKGQGFKYTKCKSASYLLSVRKRGENFTHFHFKKNPSARTNLKTAGGVLVPYFILPWMERALRKEKKETSSSHIPGFFVSLHRNFLKSGGVLHT